jgi:hypothetical protein
MNRPNLPHARVGFQSQKTNIVVSHEIKLPRDLLRTTKIKANNMNTKLNDAFNAFRRSGARIANQRTPGMVTIVEIPN